MQGFPAAALPQLVVGLRSPLEDELPRLLVDDLLRPRGHVVRLVAEADVLPRDPVVLDARVPADVRRPEVLGEVVPVSLVAEVAVPLLVVRVSRVAPLARPDLLARVRVEAEGRDARRGDDRLRRPEERARVGLLYGLVVQDEPADPLGGEDLVEARRVGVLGEPETPRPPAEDPLVLAARDPHLCADRLREVAEEGEDHVGRGAGDDLQLPRLLKGAVAARQVPLVGVEDLLGDAEPVVRLPGRVVPGLSAGALALACARGQRHSSM